MDAKGAIIEWANSQIGGTGKAIPRGFHAKPIGRTVTEPEAIITIAGGGEGNVVAERGMYVAPLVSATIWAATDKAAAIAAEAYATLLSARRGPVVMGGRTCHMITNVTGPLELPGAQGVAGYSVDATFHFSA